MLKYIFVWQIIFLFMSISLSSQKSLKNIQPPSFDYNSSKFPLTNDENVDIMIMPELNTDSLLVEDEKNLKESPDMPFRFGFSYFVDYSLYDTGNWDELENGGRVWRLKIFCPKSYSINLIYNNFYMPDGATFFLYDSSKKYVLGAFTKLNNKKHGKFATDLIPGEICWLEYYEPPEVKGIGIIEISRIINGYKDIMNSEKESNIQIKKEKILSGSCNQT